MESIIITVEEWKNTFLSLSDNDRAIVVLIFCSILAIFSLLVSIIRSIVKLQRNRKADTKQATVPDNKSNEILHTKNIPNIPNTSSQIPDNNHTIFQDKVAQRENRLSTQHYQTKIPNVIYPYIQNNVSKEADEIKQNRLDKAKSIKKFGKRNLLNGEEKQIFGTLIKLSQEQNSDLKLKIHPQVSLNSFINYENNGEDYKAGYGLSVDFLITLQNSPLAVIEYHGGGHYPTDENKKAKVIDNDGTKMHICNHAGILFQVIEESEIKDKKGIKIDPEKLRSLLQQKVFNDIC